MPGHEVSKFCGRSASSHLYVWEISREAFFALKREAKGNRSTSKICKGDFFSMPLLGEMKRTTREKKKTKAAFRSRRLHSLTANKSIGTVRGELVSVLESFLLITIDHSRHVSSQIPQSSPFSLSRPRVGCHVRQTTISQVQSTSRASSPRRLKERRKDYA